MSYSQIMPAAAGIVTGLLAREVVYAGVRWSFKDALSAARGVFALRSKSKSSPNLPNSPEHADCQQEPRSASVKSAPAPASDPVSTQRF